MSEKKENVIVTISDKQLQNVSENYKCIIRAIFTDSDYPSIFMASKIIPTTEDLMEYLNKLGYTNEKKVNFTFWKD